MQKSNWVSIMVRFGVMVFMTCVWPRGLVAENFVADTKFSVDRGFFEAPFTVEITTDTTGAQIRYTLDSSLPTATHGNVYTNPLRIETTTVLRAAAFKSGYEPTNVDTHTYLFLEDVLRQPVDPLGL